MSDDQEMDARWFRIALLGAAATFALSALAWHLVSGEIDLLARIERGDNATLFNRLIGLIWKRTILQTIMWAAPLTCVVAFYGIRWSITGRIRPLWPLSNREHLDRD